MFFHFLSIIMLLSGSEPDNTKSGEIRLKINNLKGSKGSLLISIYDQSIGFPDDPKRSVKSWKVPATSQITLEGVPAGQYALAIMHDEDGNNAMTYNYLRLPKEGFGFSGNSFGLLRPPDFKKALFAHNQALTHLSLRLRY